MYIRYTVVRYHTWTTFFPGLYLLQYSVCINTWLTAKLLTIKQWSISLYVRNGIHACKGLATIDEWCTWLPKMKCDWFKWKVSSLHQSLLDIQRTQQQSSRILFDESLLQIGDVYGHYVTRLMHTKFWTKIWILNSWRCSLSEKQSY